jgi:hypothetical protein
VCETVTRGISTRSTHADRAIANLCSLVTDEVILTSTRMHYRDPTHTNVHPQEHWTERFAGQGLIRDVRYDAAYIAPRAARHRRSTAPQGTSRQRLLHTAIRTFDRFGTRPPAS